MFAFINIFFQSNIFLDPKISTESGSLALTEYPIFDIQNIYMNPVNRI